MKGLKSMLKYKMLIKLFVLKCVFSAVYKVTPSKRRLRCFFFFTMAQHLLVGQGVLIIEYSWSHSDTIHPVGTSGRVISLTQRPLPDNIQYSQETDIHAPAGFEPTIPANKRLQTHALEPAATGIGRLCCWCYNNSHICIRIVGFVSHKESSVPVQESIKNNYILHLKCLSLQSVQVLTELSCHSYLEGSAVAAAAAVSAAGLARPVIGLIVSIASNV